MNYGVFLLACLSGAVWGHEGHTQDGGGTPAAQMSGVGMGRTVDGSAIVPKALQRSLGVRTVLAEAGEARASLRLNATVIADPFRPARVQATLAGRVQAAGASWPWPGQHVRAGQLLGWLEPVSPALEVGAARAQSEEARARLGAARSRAERMQALDGSVPRRDIDAAWAEVSALEARVRTVDTALQGRIALRAPNAGRIAELRVSPGQIVEAGQMLFDIVDPARLHVQALAYRVLPGGVQAASLALPDGRRVALGRAGTAQSFRDQAQALYFSLPAEAAGQLLPGQAVLIDVEYGPAAPAVLLPAAALVRGADGRDRVWRHEGAEVFVDVPVQARTQADGRVAVNGSIGAGERIVIQGAAALSVGVK